LSPDETAVVVEPEEKVAPEETTSVEPLPETSPEGETTAPEETGEETEPQTYEDWFKRVESNEAWKADHDARLEGVRREGYKAGQERAKASYKPMVQEHRDATIQANSILATMANTFSKAAQDGSLDPNVVNQAWEEHRGKLQYIFDTAHRTAKVSSSKDLIAYALGGDIVKGEAGQPVWRVPQEYVSLAEKYFTETDNIFNGQSTMQEIVQDFFDDLLEARIAKAKAPLQAKIKAMEASLEGKKETVRRGQGVKVAGTVGKSLAAKLDDPEWAATAPINEVMEALRQKGR